MEWNSKKLPLILYIKHLLYIYFKATVISKRLKWHCTTTFVFLCNKINKNIIWSLYCFISRYLLFNKSTIHKKKVPKNITKHYKIPSHISSLKNKIGRTVEDKFKQKIKNRNLNAFFLYLKLLTFLINSQWLLCIEMALAWLSLFLGSWCDASDVAPLFNETADSPGTIAAFFGTSVTLPQPVHLTLKSLFWIGHFY